MDLTAATAVERWNGREQRWRERQREKAKEKKNERGKSGKGRKIESE